MTTDGTLDGVMTLRHGDGPRHAFARANPETTRAALIEGQLALSGPESAAAERGLLDLGVDPAWDSAFRALGLQHPPDRPGWLVRRGFVEHITTTADVLIKKGEALFAQEPIRSVLVLRCSPSELAALARAPWLRHVESLGLIVRKNVSLAPLFASEHLVSLRDLDLNWVSADQTQFPTELGPEPIEDLCASPVLGQLRALRVSVAKPELAVRVAASTSRLESFGLRSRTTWSRKVCAAVGQAIAMPALRRLVTPHGVAPAHAPLLTAVEIARGGVPDALAGQLDEVKLVDCRDSDLTALANTSAKLRRLTIGGIVSIDDAARIWQALAVGRWPALRSLDVFAGIPIRETEARQLADQPWVAAVEQLCLSGHFTRDTVPLVGALTGLRDLRIAWSIADQPAVVPAPPTVERLGVTCRAGLDTWMRGLDAPRLFALSLAAVINQPSLNETAARALLELAPEGQRCLWARLAGLRPDTAAALHRRFTVYDGGINGGPLSRMSDWTWQGHTWHTETLSVL